MTRLEHAGTDPDTGRHLWVLHLLPLEASLIRTLPDQVEGLLRDPDQNRRVMDRLFPPSYSDPDEERDNRELLGSALLDERRELLSDTRALLAGGEGEKGGLTVDLQIEALDVLLRFLNDVRLILATDLGIDDNIGELEVDADDPEAPKYALLEYLSGLEAILVEAATHEFGGDGSSPKPFGV